MKVGDKFIDLDGNIATVMSLDPFFQYEVQYGDVLPPLILQSTETFKRFIPMTELNKALV